MCSEVTTAFDRSVVAEVAYPVSDGTITGAAFVPFTLDGEPVFALSYADRPVTEALSGARSVAVACTDARLALRGWQPMAAEGTVTVEADPDGDRYQDDLIDQELRKYPPARLFVDSLMARREHWWYVPRLIVRFRPERVWAVAPRDDPFDGVLVWEEPAGLEADTVGVDELADDRLSLRSLRGTTLRGSDAPACLLRHDYSIPDFEERTVLTERGRLRGDVLEVSGRDGRLELPVASSLRIRWRRARAFERACKRELRQAARERRQPPTPR